MTKAEFKTLKVGSRVAIPQRGGGLMSTEVLKLDPIFLKATVLCGTKPYSYRYLRPESKYKWGAPGNGPCVGICHDGYSPFIPFL